MSRVSTRSLARMGRWPLAARIRAIFKTGQLRRQRRLAARALAGMSDHALKDMGLSRCGIHGLVYGTPADRQRDGHDDVAL